MEDVLKRLLDTEHKAEALVDEARAERDRILDAAQAEVRAAEAQLDARLPDLRAGYLNKAHERAEQAITEATRRSGERQHTLRQQAEANEPHALAAALSLITAPDM